MLPWLLWQVSRTDSRELFTLAVIAKAIGIAYGASALFNVSFALGAFFAGSVADFGFAVKRGQLRVDLIAGAVIGTAHTMQLPP